MSLVHQRPFLTAYCIVCDEDRILPQRRLNTGYLDGYWALPSGHVSDEERALAAASRELREETELVVDPTSWVFVCAMHRRTERTIVDLFFSTRSYLGTPRICEPDKCDGLAFFPLDAPPAPMPGYIAHAIDCLRGLLPPQGPDHGEGWA